MWTKAQQPSMIARRQAMLHGWRFYYGRPCSQGHTLRYTASGQCVTCAKARASRAYNPFRKKAAQANVSP